MTFKVAVSSYHVVYVDSTDDEDEATMLVIDRLRDLFKEQQGMRSADYETTLDFCTPLD